MRTGKRLLTVVLLLSAGSILNAASASSNEKTLSISERSYQSQLADINTVRLHVKDGDFRIVGVDSDDITIHTAGKNLERAARMKVQLKRSGDVLDLTFSNVPKNEFQVIVAIPKQTGLFARMRGGDLSVAGITGNKDLELVGGDMSIQVPDPAEYGPVDLSVKVGDVSGTQFGDPKGWIGNSIKRDGSGKYRLHAHVFAGDLTLRP